MGSILNQSWTHYVNNSGINKKKKDASFLAITQDTIAMKGLKHFVSTNHFPEKQSQAYNAV